MRNELTRAAATAAMAVCIQAVFLMSPVVLPLPAQSGPAGLPRPGNASGAPRAPSAEDCLAAARKQISEGRLEEAYARLSACRKTYPDDVNLAAELAILVSRLGSNQEAERLFEFVIEKEPHHKDARLRLAQLLLDDGRPDQARKHAEFLTRTFPEWAEGFDLLGRCSSEEGDLASAEIFFKRAASLDPTSSTFPFNAGVVLWKQKKPAEALKSFERSIGLNESCVECRFWKAKCLLELGKTDAGLELLREVSQDRLWGAKAAYQMGAAFLQSGEADSAVFYLEKAVEEDPTKPAWYNVLASAYARAGRTDEAVKAYEKAGGLAKQKSHFQYEQGRLLLGEGKAEEAAKLFQAALDEDSSLAPAWLGLAFSLKGSKPLAASEALARYVALAPKDLERRLMLAAWLSRSGRSEEALDRARGLMEEDLSPDQLSRLGSLLLQLERPGDAERILQKSLRTGKPTAELCHNLGFAYEKLGDLDRAIRFYEEELKIDPENRRSRLDLAILYFNLERDADSTRHLEFLITRYPGSEEARRAREIVQEIRQLQ